MAEYLSDEEVTERLKRWWSENGTGLLVGIVLAIGGVVGWRWFDGWRVERAEAASDRYAEYTEARAAGEDVTDVAAHIAEEFPDSAYRVFTLLHQARDAVEGEEWESAADLLRQSVDIASESVLQDVARVRLARVLHQLERPEDALAVLREVDGQGFAATVAELTGDIELRRGALPAARAAYQAALDETGAGQGGVLLRLKLASVPREAADHGAGGNGAVSEAPAPAPSEEPAADDADEPAATVDSEETEEMEETGEADE